MVSLGRGPFTRTGIRRSGDDYQDAVALDVLVDWLANPDAVEYVRVEADDAGALDDVVVVTHNSVVAIQVKFSGHPDHDDSRWSLSSLLTPGAVSGAGSPRRASLLEKWLRSLDVLGASHPGRTIDARVVTNRSPASNLARALTDAGTLDLDRVEDDGLRAQVVQLIEELGKDTAVLSNLRFQFNHPGLEDLEDSVRDKFIQLGFDDRGWLSLNNSLRRWIRLRHEPPPNGHISMAAVRQASEWRELRGLPQEFPVPTDYVSPSREFDVDVRTAIDSAERCQVIVASPGLGKSTYVSALCRRLNEERYPVVRHHYFLSQREHAGRRLRHQDAAESLLHDLKRDYGDALGAMAARQLSYSDLREALGVCGAYYEQHGRHLVVLLDGLDHVWRERKSADELAQLLDDFFPLPSGVALMVATQPVADEQLPSVLLRAVPRRLWKELPRFDRRATTEWVTSHGTELDLAEDAGNKATLERLSEAFFEISNGHPLHLRYSLGALLESGQPISEYSVSGLPPCPTGEITDYYEGLVRALDEAGRLVLLLIACGHFPWPRSGLVDCLGGLGVDRVTAVRGLAQVNHLLRRASLGLLPFHSSLLVFMRSTEDYATQQRDLGTAVVQWLERDAPAYWRWAYGWLLRAELGEVDPLRDGPNRAWVLEAIAMRRPASTTEKLLAQSGAVALTPDDLPTALQRGVSCLYFSDAFEFRRDAAESALFAQLSLEEDEFLPDWLSEDIAHLTPHEVCLLAERADASERPSEVERCYEELRRRVNSGEFNEARDHEPWTERMAPMYRVAAIARKPSSAVRYALRRGTKGRRLVRHMVEEMRIRRDADGLREALRLAQEWMPDEGHSVDQDTRHNVEVEFVNGIMLLAFEESLDVSDVFVGRVEFEALASVNLYQSSRGHRVTRPVGLPVLELPDVRYLTPEQRIGLREAIRDVFFGLLTNHHCRSGDANEAWLDGLHCSDWVGGWFRRLNAAAEASAAEIRSGARVTPDRLLSPFGDLELPRWRGGATESDFEFGTVACDSLCALSIECIGLSGRRANERRLSQIELEQVWTSPFVRPWQWVKNAVTSRRKLLDEDALRWTLASRSADLEVVDEAFYERAEHFAWLAALAVMHGWRREATDLLRRYASNQLSHGHHKDMCLTNTLSAIQTFAEDELKETCRLWLLRLAKPIAEVGHFTDGDETRHLPVRLGQALREVAPDCLGVYYSWLVTHEQYDDAGEVFRELLKIIDLSISEGRAVALTAITQEHREILEARGDSGDRFARVVVDALNDYLGVPLATAGRASESEERTRPVRAGSPLSVTDYDPSRFEDYRKALVASRDFDRTARIQTWLDHWRAEGRGVEALLAVVQARAKIYGIEDVLWREFRDQVGREEAFPWLVEAQKNGGWNEWLSKRADSEERWRVVARDYPNMWFDFLRESLIEHTREGFPEAAVGHGAWPRIVAFLLVQGQRDLAVRSVEAIVDAALDLVSAGDLGPEPSWVGDCSGQTQDIARR